MNALVMSQAQRQRQEDILLRLKNRRQKLREWDLDINCTCVLYPTDDMYEAWCRHSPPGENAYLASLPAAYRLLVTIFGYEPCEHVLQLFKKHREHDDKKLDELFWSLWPIIYGGTQEDDCLPLSEYLTPRTDYRQLDEIDLKIGPVTQKGKSYLYANRRAHRFHLYHPDDIDAGNTDGLTIASRGRLKQGRFTSEKFIRDDDQEERDADIWARRLSS